MFRIVRIAVVKQVFEGGKLLPLWTLEIKLKTNNPKISIKIFLESLVHKKKKKKIRANANNGYGRVTKMRT